MKVDKSAGTNQMYPRTLWENREEIAEIHKSLLDMGEAPKEWRVASVVPHFKEGLQRKTLEP